MNFKDKYRAEVDEIEVPESLTKSTLQKMKDEKSDISPSFNALDQKKNINKKNKGKLLSFSIPVIVAASFLIVVSTRTPSSPITTSLTDYQHVEEVELSDGQLYFDSTLDQENAVIQINPNFGLASDSSELLTENEFLESGFLVPKDWENFKISEKEYTSFFSKKQEKTIYEYNYLLTDETKSIEVEATSESLTPKKNNSTIGEVKLYLAYSEERQVYYGEFNKDEITYTITAKNLTEKEFITFLLFFLK